MEEVIYRQACKHDVSLVLSFIRDLAAYEKLSHEVLAGEQDIEVSLFGPDAKAFCIIAECLGQPAGFAVCFYNYSTFLGRSGIYIEDIFVKPDYRGQGIGKGFFKVLAQKALNENCGRIEWWVLDWNEPSIAFYKKLGAVAMDEWTVYRMDRNAIRACAEG